MDARPCLLPRKRVQINEHRPCEVPILKEPESRDLAVIDGELDGLGASRWANSFCGDDSGVICTLDVRREGLGECGSVQDRPVQGDGLNLSQE